MATTHEIPKIYTLDRINAAISSSKFDSDLVDAIRQGFVSYSSGGFNACPIQTMGAPPMAPFCGDTDKYAAQTCVKSGYLTCASHYVIKVASGGYPFENSGLMQVYSQTTGRLEALLLDEGILTELRTAAAGALAAQYLATSDINCIGILGTGVQARYQLRFLKTVTDCRKVLVWGRTPSNVQCFIQDMVKEGWAVEVAKEPNELLQSCELIVTTTSSRQALLGVSCDYEKIKKSLHITCIGADASGKHELDPQLVAQADLLVADSKLQTQERGEYQQAISQGLVKLDDVVELGDLVLEEGKNLQKHKESLTIFDSSGVAVQDCVVAKMVHDTLLELEIP